MVEDSLQQAWIKCPAAARRASIERIHLVLEYVEWTISTEPHTPAKEQLKLKRKKKEKGAQHTQAAQRAASMRFCTTQPAIL